MLRAPGTANAASGAQRLVDLAVHMDQPLRAGAFMQLVDILRDEDHLARMLGLEAGEGEVSGVRGDVRMGFSAHIVEVEDALGIARITLGRRDIPIVDLGPDAAFVAEGRQTGFG